MLLHITEAFVLYKVAIILNQDVQVCCIGLWICEFRSQDWFYTLASELNSDVQIIQTVIISGPTQSKASLSIVWTGPATDLF